MCKMPPCAETWLILNERHRSPAPCLDALNPKPREMIVAAFLNGFT